MNSLENVIYARKIVAFVIRKDIEIDEGINFFTKAHEPLQLAIHHHKNGKETKIHSNLVVKPYVQSQKYKYIYIVKGSATVDFFNSSEKSLKKINLRSGDSIMIMNVLHKFIFSPKTKAIEIKQGPYTND